MDRLRRSFVVFRDLLAALRQDMDILFYPVLAAIFATLAAAGIVFRGNARGAFEVAPGESVLPTIVAVLVYGLLVYLAVSVVATFFGVCIVRGAQLRLEGGDQRISDGLLAAFRRFPQVLAFALASATVGVVLRFLEPRAKPVNRAVKARIGGRWSASSYFAGPVMVFEEKGLVAGLWRSAELVKTTWGNEFSQQVGIGPFVKAAAAPAVVLPGALGFAFGASGAVAGLAVALLWWIGLGVLSASLFAIHVTSLYYFATTGEVADGVSEAMLAGAHAARP